MNTRLQITLTARYVGRGLWRRIFGSGPLRLTPIDVAISDNDKPEVEAAANTLNEILSAQPPSKHRIGSLFDVTDLRVSANIKSE